MSELLARSQALLEVLAATPILAIGLTLGAFFAGNWLFSRFGRPVWLPPVVLAACLLAGVIAVLAIDYGEYR